MVEHPPQALPNNFTKAVQINHVTIHIPWGTDIVTAVGAGGTLWAVGYRTNMLAPPTYFQNFINCGFTHSQNAPIGDSF